MAAGENFDLIVFAEAIPAAMDNTVDCLRPVAKLARAFRSILQGSIPPIRHLTSPKAQMRTQ